MQCYRKQKGFSLIELMVSLLIGMITVVVITQVMAFSEGQKRTTTTGSDAQINGNLALFTIEREAKNAGWGIVGTLSALGCEIRAKYGSTTMTITLAPVTITNGVSGAPDTIRFIASTKSGGALPTRISVDHPATASNFFVDSDVGINQNDLMIAVPATPTASNWCTLVQITNDPTVGGTGQGGGQGQNQIIHNSGQSPWNQPGGQNIFPPGGYVAGDYLLNLGAMIDHTYSIANVGSTTPPRALQLASFNTSNNILTTSELYPHIVDLQAQYGKDDGSNGGTADDGIVDGWDTVTPNNNAGWRRVLAIRVAVLSRSINPEKQAVTFNTPVWASGPFNMSWDTGWDHYRYKVYETTAPIRNLIWRQ